MIINFEKLRNHSPEQSNNIVCLSAFIYEKHEDIYKQRLYDMGFDMIVNLKAFNASGDSYTVAKIQF